MDNGNGNPGAELQPIPERSKEFGQSLSAIALIAELANGMSRQEVNDLLEILKFDLHNKLVIIHNAKARGEARTAVQTFKVGDMAMFTERRTGWEWRGRITKINKTTIDVQASEVRYTNLGGNWQQANKNWRCAASVLRPAEVA